MPRYFFHVHDGRSTPDTDGTEYPSFADARLEAVRYVGRLVHEQARSIATGQDWHLELADATGLILFRIDILASNTAASGSGQN